MQWAVIFLIVSGWLIIKMFEGISDSISSANNSKEKKEKFNEERNKKYLNRIIDQSKDLYERNIDIIEAFERNVSTSTFKYYYIENQTRDCINEICLAENRNDIKPSYAYLSTWLNNAPQEYRALSSKIEKLFKDRKKALEKEIENEEENKIKGTYKNLLSKHSDIIEQFKDIAYRKVTILDSYGEESWDVLDKELDFIISKIAKKEGHSDEDLKKWKKHSFYIPKEFISLRDHLNTIFKSHYNNKKKQPINDVDVSMMSGTEFEVYLANLLKSNGFNNVTGTATTGDQGADLIAKKDGKTIIIQAKRYSGSVGNKAVQEVISALSFYGGDEGWVMTNSMFTRSAKELASKSGVRLFDLYDLKHFNAKDVSI